MEKRRLGYIRVSTADQCINRQVDALKQQCDELHVEHGVSARAKHRPVFENLIDGILQEGDTLVVLDLDRAFRSTVDAINTADALGQRGIHLHIVNLAVDTATPAGMMIYTVMAALAQYERDLTRQRVREGMIAARGRGKHIGRPMKLSSVQLMEARKMSRRGESQKVIAEVVGVSTRTLRKYLHNAEPGDTNMMGAEYDKL